MMYAARPLSPHATPASTPAGLQPRKLPSCTHTLAFLKILGKISTKTRRDAAPSAVGSVSMLAMTPDDKPIPITLFARRRFPSLRGSGYRVADVRVAETTASFRADADADAVVRPGYSLVDRHRLGGALLDSDVAGIDGGPRIVGGMVVVGKAQLKCRLGSPGVRFPANKTFELPVLVVNSSDGMEVSPPVRLSRKLLERIGDATADAAAWQQAGPSDSQWSNSCIARKPKVKDGPARAAKQEETGRKNQKERERRMAASDNKTTQNSEKSSTQGGGEGGKKERESRGRERNKDNKENGKQEGKSG